jgi:hypothetical protein
MLGAGLTTTAAVADLVVSAAEVATTETVVLDVTVAGVLYVAEVAVTFLKPPHAEPVHPVPVADQVTPLLLESLLTVAVYATVCPWSRVVWVEGERETEIGCELGGLLPPPPHPYRSNDADKTKRRRLM